MSDTESSIEEIFSRHWSIYRKVIDCNYMDHQELRDAISERLLPGSMGNILDLGCGDAEISSSLVKDRDCVSFTGVDSSDRALAEAAKRDVWEQVSHLWVEVDLLDFVQSSTETYDLIFAGFSVHHLSAEEKQEFLRATQARLSAGGTLYYYDVFRLPGLERKESIAKYLTWIRDDWAEITEDEFSLIEDHITSADFPESLDWTLQVAEEAGFQERVRLRDFAHGFHTLLALS